MTMLDTQSKGIEGLADLAQTYFDAAYDMDADKFASIFHEASTVTREGENDSVVVTPVAAWLDTVRAMNSPRQAGVERQDRIVSINLGRNMALLQLRLRIPPREVTDLLSCFFINGRWRIIQKVFEAAPLH
jgi:putative lumazine-binding protein